MLETYKSVPELKINRAAANRRQFLLGTNYTAHNNQSVLGDISEPIKKLPKRNLNCARNLQKVKQNKPYNYPVKLKLQQQINLRPLGVTPED